MAKIWGLSYLLTILGIVTAVGVGLWVTMNGWCLLGLLAFSLITSDGNGGYKEIGTMKGVAILLGAMVVAAALYFTGSGFCILGLFLLIWI